MGFLSQSGQLAFKTQTAKGTYLDPGAVAPNQGVFIRFKSGGMSGNRELLVPDPEIGAGRDIPDAALGPVSYSGQYDAYCRSEFLATMLNAAMGGPSVDSGSALLGWTHTIPWGTTLPWLSVEEKMGNGFEIYKYTDAKVNTFHMEADANGYLMCTFGITALTGLSGQTATTTGQRIDTSPLLLGSKITVSYNGAQLPAKSFSLDINNNLEDNDFRLGSLFLGDLTEKRREVTAACSIRPADSTLWKQAMYGVSSGTAPSTALTTKQQVIVTITSWEDIPGANAGVKYVTTLTFPKTIIAPFGVTPSGDDVLQHDLELRPVLGTGTTLGTVSVVNSYATVA